MPKGLDDKHRPFFEQIGSSLYFSHTPNGFHIPFFCKTLISSVEVEIILHKRLHDFIANLSEGIGPYFTYDDLRDFFNSLVQEPVYKIDREGSFKNFVETLEKEGKIKKIMFDDGPKWMVLNK